MSLSITAFDMPDTYAFDRYRVLFTIEGEAWALSIGPTGNVPNGVCMTTEHTSPTPYPGEVPIEIADLPEPVQRAVENEKRLYAQHVASGH